MSRRGNCRDDAVAKSLSSRLEKERIGKRACKTCEPARADVFDGIEVFHDRTCRHAQLRSISPDAFKPQASA